MMNVRALRAGLTVARCRASSTRVSTGCRRHAGPSRTAWRVLKTILRERVTRRPVDDRRVLEDDEAELVTESASIG